jgi:hypothetical protein
MDTRTQLHAILDDLDEDELISAEIYLLAIVHRRAAPEASEAQLDSLDERGQLFQRAAEERWREAGQRAKDRGLGFLMGFGGGGGFGFDLRGRANGKMHFSYSDEGASVEETLRFIAGQEIEIWDRFGISDEGDGLLYKQIVKSGGRDLTREEVFPLQDTDGNTRVIG